MQASSFCKRETAALRLRAWDARRNETLENTFRSRKRDDAQGDEEKAAHSHTERFCAAKRGRSRRPSESAKVCATKAKGVSTTVTLRKWIPWRRCRLRGRGR